MSCFSEADLAAVTMTVLVFLRESNVQPCQAASQPVMESEDKKGSVKCLDDQTSSTGWPAFTALAVPLIHLFSKKCATIYGLNTAFSFNK